MLLTYLILFADKNYKETFMKKINLCMKTYDYKDETKDVKGKVSLISRPALCEIDLMSFLANLDRETQRYHWASDHAPGLEKCGERHNP